TLQDAGKGAIGKAAETAPLTLVLVGHLAAAPGSPPPTRTGGEKCCWYLAGGNQHRVRVLTRGRCATRPAPGAQGRAARAQLETLGRSGQLLLRLLVDRVDGRRGHGVLARVEWLRARPTMCCRCYSWIGRRRSSALCQCRCASSSPCGRCRTTSATGGGRPGFPFECFLFASIAKRTMAKGEHSSSF